MENVDRTIIGGSEILFQTLVEGVERGGYRTDLLEPGARIHHYEVLKLIGRGGTSVVYGARHMYLNHQVALKTVPPAAPARDVGARFIREAQALAVFNHPGVIRVHDAGYHDRTPYLIVEWLRGRTVRSHLLSQGPLSVERTLDFLEEIGAVLLRQEELGVIHRDIKPGNVYLRTDGHFCLFDYGLVGAESDGGSSLASVNVDLTTTGVLMGTPRYLAPEQASGMAGDHRSDQYSLGLTAWECLAGRPARDGETLFEVLQASQEPLPPITSLRAGVPPEVETLIATLTAVDPADRYASAAEFLADLQRYRYRGREPYGAALGSVFVATPFTKAFDPVFETIFESALGVRLSARRVDQLVYLENIWQQIVFEIESALVVIADFTGAAAGGDPNPNVVTEAAHARAIKKPLILLTQDAPERLPFDWRHVPVVRYENTEPGLAQLQEVLESKLRHCMLNT